MTLDNAILPGEDAGFSLSGAADALLKRWKTDEKVPSEGEETAGEPAAGTETAGEGAQTDQADEAETAKTEDPEKAPDAETTEEKPEEAPKADVSDDLKVVIKVGDEEHQVSVRDLKRLYGQEASLTRKSQQVAEAQKKASEAAERHMAALTAEAKKAEARFSEYRKIDWTTLQARVAAGQVSPQAFADLRRDAEAAYADYKYYVEGIDAEVRQMSEHASKKLQEQAQACVRELQNPEGQHYIEGWNEKLYDDLRDYAVRQGVAAEVINSTVEPAALKIIHKAMLYDARKNVVETKLATKPVVPASPKTVLKPGTGADTTGDKAKEAMTRLRKEGSRDAATAALLARWQ